MSMTRREFGAGLTTLGAMASLSPAFAQSGGVIKIGSLHPLTGPLALDGQQMDSAIKLAANAINEAGGIKALGGAKLEILSADTQGKPDVGQTEAQRMIDAGVVALIGCYQSGVSQNVATVATRARVPLVLDITAADSVLQQGSKYVFRVQPNSSTIGRKSAEFLAAIAAEKNTSFKKIAYLRDESEFGRSIFSAFETRAKELGMEVALDLAFDPFRTTDLTTEMTRVAAAKVDVLAVTGYFNDGLLVARAVNAVRPDVQAIYGVAQAAFEQEAIFDGIDPAMAQNFLASSIRYNGASEGVAKLRQKFKDELGAEMRLSAPFGYQCVEVIAAALETVTEPTGAKLRDAIAGIELGSTMLAYPGPIKFDEIGENISATPQVVQIQNGKIVQVWPKDFAEAELALPARPW